MTWSNPLLLSVYYHHTGCFYYRLCSHPVTETVCAGSFFLLAPKLFRMPAECRTLCSA